MKWQHRPRGNIKIYDSFTTVIYTFKVSKHIIIGQSTNINVFSWLLFFFKLRERESGIQNLGIKEKWPQSYLSYFLTGFHWRIFLLSRANRLYSIFLHWLEEPGVPHVSDILLSSTRSKWPWVCLPRALLKNWLSSHFFRRRGEGCHFRFRAPANHLASTFLLPPWSGNFVRATRCHPSQVTVNSNTRSSNFISLLPVGYHVTKTN